MTTSPIYLEFLSGKRELTCTAWGNPTRNVKGWKGPCYLITDEHHETFDDLMDNTDWDKLRPRQGPALRALHGPLRLRAVGRAGRQQQARRQPQDADVAIVVSEPIPADGPRSPGGSRLSDVVCMVFALSHEAAPFLRRFPATEPIADAPCWAHFCGNLLVLQTGVGPKRMERALTWLLPHRLRLILSAGYSGALTEQHGVADLIVATEVIDGQGGRWPTTWSAAPSDWHRGCLLCWPRLVGEPEQKRRLGNEHGAVAVDMETAVVARLCSEQQVPFGCLRVISDGVNDRLSPELLAVLSGPRLAWWKLLAMLMRSPARIGELIRLARHARRASQHLTAGLIAVVDALSRPSPPTCARDGLGRNP